MTIGFVLQLFFGLIELAQNAQHRLHCKLRPTSLALWCVRPDERHNLRSQRHAIQLVEQLSPTRPLRTHGHKNDDTANRDSGYRSTTRRSVSALEQQKA